MPGPVRPGGDLLPVRVLWLTKGLGRGGAERLLVGAVERLDRARFEVEVAYLLPWKDAFVPDVERLGVPVHCLGGRQPLDPRWLGRLRRLVRGRSFDLVHTHMPYVAVGARAACRRRVTIVHTEHNMWDRYRVPTRWANRLTYPRNAAVIAVSAAVAASIRPLPMVRSWPPVTVIRHGADIAAVRQATASARARARAALGLAEDAPVVGSVGNFTVKKDHRTLLEAVALAAADRPELQLVLVGSGPLEDALRHTTASMGLTDRVVFAGSREDALDLLPAFDVFALSSQHEGLPIALLEAMASGIPCVATAVGGVPEVLTNAVEGFSVAPGDPAALASALDKLLGDPSLRQDAGRRAAETASRFDLTEAVRRTEAVYLEALGR